MIEVTVGSTTDRKKVMVTPTDSVRSVLDAEGIDYSNASILLDGTNIKTGEMDKSFTDLGITDKCYLIASIKASNA